ncbi:PKD domain-containing protein [Winogradskyella sp. 4-2091]|uniref:PKD domain-containing protein n=1 Tax=Winogradskyella sp. 4-2091 TaxID=3381659 RepID=UPI0038912EBA
MLKKLSLLFFFLLSLFAEAQGEANNWYFGRNAGLDFNSGSPTVLLDGALDTNEGCAAISNTDGNLLFYTDGITVYNSNHAIMQSGTDLGGNPSSTHSAIVVPKPDEPDQYYIFTVDIWNSFNAYGLSYSEVDMTLDNGLGAVTDVKNIQLEPVVHEKVIAILNENQDGYWVVSHRHDSNEFLAYEVTASGVNTSPVISAVGSQTGFFLITGQIRISPNGNRLAVARGGEVQVFDFDNATGVISNPITIDNIVSSYGIEFSPSGRFLYVACYEGLYQFDLQQITEADIMASIIPLIELPGEGFTSMQIAPDGKIYVARTFRYYLGVINNPNTLGLNCNYVDQGVYLLGRESTLGLPTFMQSFFNVGFEAEDVCEGNTSSFTANISQAYDSLIWDFGDGTTSTDGNPTHTYAVAGDYEVSLSVTSGSENSLDAKTITVYENPIVAPLVELRQCDDDLDGFSNFNLNEANADYCRLWL